MDKTAFDYETCKGLILDGLLESLTGKTAEISNFPKFPIGTTTIHHMCVDFHPWHNSITVSFCDHQDDPKDIAAWKYYSFISSDNADQFPTLKRAADYLTRFYDPTFFMEEEEYEEWEENEEENETDDPTLSHIIFLAGAEAVLDNRIARVLRDCGIDTAPIFEHPLEGYRSDFFVVENTDGKAIEANYCDIVRANRATKLFFEEFVKYTQ